MPRHTTQPAFTSRGLSGPPWRSVPKATSSHCRLRYICHGILLSLLNYTVDWVTRRVVSKATSSHRRLRYICHGILLSLLDFPVDRVTRRVVSKATSSHRRLRYICHGILLSLLDFPVDRVTRPCGVYRRTLHHNRRLRYASHSACLYVLGNNLRTFRCSLSKSIYGGIHVYSQMCKRNVLRREYKKFNKKNSRTWNWKWS